MPKPMVEFEVEEWSPESWQFNSIGSFKVPRKDVRMGDAFGGDRPTMSIDLPDGEYGDGSRRIQRLNVEATRARFLWGVDRPEFEGFASIELFDDDDNQTPLWEGYRKVRMKVMVET